MPKFGDIVKGQVVKIVRNKKGEDVGALVNLSTGDVAFLPVKEISKDFVKKIDDYVKVGEEKEFRITGKNKKMNQLNLSLKRVDDSVNKEIQFQKKLDRFMKDSQMKLAELKKNNERKQSGKKPKRREK